MKRILLAFLTLFILTGCGSGDKRPPRVANHIKLGTIAGPETEVMEVAAVVAEAQYKLKVDLVTFTDYNLPNQALDEGSIDANAFQHGPYLKAAIANKGYRIVPIARTFIFPMAIYSKRVQSLDALADGSSIAIPNDPSNEARALLLLQKANLITLKKSGNLQSSVDDIASNPKDLKIKELDAAQLARVLTDVDLAVINTNFALKANLDANKDALFMEDNKSTYANLLVVHEADKDRPEFKTFMRALRSREVAIKVNTLFSGQAKSAW